MPLQVSSGGVQPDVGIWQVASLVRVPCEPHVVVQGIDWPAVQGNPLSIVPSQSLSFPSQASELGTLPLQLLQALPSQLCMPTVHSPTSEPQDRVAPDVPH
jgi:hypothetical protein